MMICMICRPQSARLYTNTRTRAGASPTPWDSDGSRAGTPEILEVGDAEEQDPADSELLDGAESAELARVASGATGVSSLANAAGREAEVWGSAAAASAGSSPKQLTGDAQALVKELHGRGIGTDGGDGYSGAVQNGGFKIKQLSQKAATGELRCLIRSSNTCP